MSAASVRSRWGRTLALLASVVLLAGCGSGFWHARTSTRPETDAERSAALARIVSASYKANGCYPVTPWTRVADGFGIAPAGIGRDAASRWPSNQLYGAFDAGGHPVVSGTAFYVGVVSRSEWQAHGAGNTNPGYAWIVNGKTVPVCETVEAKTAAKPVLPPAKPVPPPAKPVPPPAKPVPPAAIVVRSAADVAESITLARAVSGYYAATGCYPATPWLRVAAGFGRAPEGMGRYLSAPWPANQLYGAFNAIGDPVSSGTAYYVGVVSRSEWQANGGGNTNAGYSWIVDGKTVNVCRSAKMAILRAIPVAVALAITGACLVWLLVSFVRSPERAVPLLAGILTLPLFLRFSGSGIALGDENTAHFLTTGQTLPVGIFGVALFAAVGAAWTAAGRTRWRRSSLIPLGAAFIVVNVISFLLGVRETFYIEDLGLLAQTVGPVLCLFLAVGFARDAQTVRRAATTSVYVMGFSVVVIAISTLLVQAPLRQPLHAVLGLNQVHLGPFPVYQSHDYFPTAVAVAYGLGLALLLGRVPVWSRAWLGALVVAMFASVFFLHSAGAFLTMVAITVAEFLAIPTSRSRRTALAGVAAAAVLAGVLILAPQSSTLSHLRHLVSGGDEADLATRSIEARRTMEEILRDPLAGSRYLARTVDVRGIRHISYPHNQYLTYASRAGLISLLLYVLLVGVALQHLARVIRFAPSVERSLAIGLSVTLLGVLLISNMLQDNFVEPYSANLLWLFLGLGEALYLATAGRGDAPPGLNS